MQFESLQIPSTQPQVAANATTGPTTPVPPRPQITPALVPMTAPATAPVANAGYRHDATQPGPPQVARTSHEHVARQQPTVQQASSHEFALQPSTMHPAVVQPISTPSTASQHMPSQASVVTRTYQPAPHPNAYPATLQRYVTHSHEYGSNYATSQRAYGKQSAVQPTQRVTRSIAATERTEYVGTLDAFNMRMTMVVRPPGMANFGMKPVSQWFSGPSSMDPAESSPTLHRVSSTMRYAAQPRAIR